MPDLHLDPVEARVIACLVEKSIATPAYYPMTVNGLTAAANQKSSRAPVMNLPEGEIGAALNRLEDKRLAARDDSSGRSVKWRHRFQHELLLKTPSLAVLVTLMLRGPQTQAELRASAAPLGGPAEVEALQQVLNDLADRAQPLVVQLPRAAGQSASRYAHTLSGVPEAGEVVNAAREEEVVASQDRYRELLARIEALEARVASLESTRG